MSSAEFSLDARSPRTGSPKDVSPSIGSPREDCLFPDTADDSLSFLEQAQVSTVRQETTRATIDQAIDGDEHSADAPPTSWSFAARQRCECARIARVFRYARHRMRQELRGLALDHAELLLGAVSRIVAADGDRNTTHRAAGVCSPDIGPAGRRRHQDGSRLDHDGHGFIQGRCRESEERASSRPSQGICFEGGELGRQEPGRQEDGGEGKAETRGGRRGQDVWKLVGRTRANLRHEARPHDEWNRRWALAVDEENMGLLSTLGLEGAMPEMGTVDRFERGEGTRTGAAAELLVEWRKAFRRTVALTAGIRHPARLCASQRCESKGVL